MSQQQTKGTTQKRMPGPWVEETEEQWDSKTNDLVMKGTGWIEGVLEYEGCGSHRAKWLNEADKKLALAAPVLVEALKAVKTYGYLAGDNKQLVDEALKLAGEAQ
jgi:hypothetical protein